MPTAGSPFPPADADTSPTRTSPGIWLNVGLFLLVTFTGAGLLAALQPRLGIGYTVIEIVQFAPALGLLAVLLARVRKPEKRSAVRVSVKVSPGVAGRLGAALGINAAVFAAALGFLILTGGDVSWTEPGDLPAPFLLIVLTQLVGACGEEVGWRCFLQPQLQQRIGTIAAGVLVGLLWGVWHVQIFAAPLAYAGAFLISTVSMSVILAVLLERSTRGNLLVAGFFHTVTNLGMLLILDEESGDPAEMALLGVPWAVLAVFASVISLRRSAHAAR